MVQVYDVKVTTTTATETLTAMPTHVVEGRRSDGSIEVLDTFYSREAAAEAHACYVFGDAGYTHYRVRSL